MAELGDAHLRCPACNAPILLPLTQLGAASHSITLATDLGAVRRHVAERHHQEPTMSAFTDRLDAFFSKFVKVSHEELTKVEQAVEEKVQPLVAEAVAEYKADVTRLEKQLKALEAKVEQMLNAGPAAS